MQILHKGMYFWNVGDRGHDYWYMRTVYAIAQRANQSVHVHGVRKEITNICF